MSYSQTPLTVVIDANLTVRTVLPLGKGREIEYIEKWHQAKTQILAPDLWYAESVSAIRRIMSLNLITAGEGYQAIKDLFALDVQVIPSDLRLCESAFKWAERLGHSKAYDSFYLALAEWLSAERQVLVELWTADERLVNRARQVGAPWVRLVGEGE
ncbi:MAG: type II toxin-antitoxin system VapC family toxin [Anaerolineales bacterium]|nr:type II toxin-antitoxin system VapC family toxin [Anaerolineales bacterium]